MSEAESIFPGGAYEGDDDSVASMGTITASAYSLRFESESFTLDFPSQGLCVELDESGERVFFEHPNFPGWKIYSLDPGILDRSGLKRFGLSDTVKHLCDQRSGAAQHGTRVYLAFGVIIGIVLFLWLGTNAMLGFVVKRMPDSWEKSVGDEQFAEFSKIFQPSDEPAEYTNRIHLVAQRLKRGLPREAPKFDYHLSLFPLTNAFALPGGHVIVLSGLVEDATPDELAGVLAHELSHVIEKHPMRQMAQTAGPVLIVDYIFGRDSAALKLVGANAAFGQFQPSRENEREADNEAWDILVKANIDPRCLTRYFKKMRKSQGDEDDSGDIFSTHPATSERIAYLEKRWESEPKKSGYQPVDGGPEIEKHRTPPPVVPFGAKYKMKRK